MKNIFILIIVVLGTTYSSMAQLPYDAVRFSQWNISSSARTAGLGGAFGALGADVSMVSYNPGGLGVFRTSEVALSPSYSSIDVDAKLLDSDSPSSFETNSKFRFNNWGVVLHRERSNSSNWKSINFAFTGSRLANFGQTVFYEGNSKGSIVNSFVDKANGKLLSELDNNVEGLAYDVGAIWDTGETTYTSDLTVDDAVNKKQIIERSGYLQEYSIAIGANYNNKFMIGGSIGFPFVKYRQYSEYEESFNSPTGLSIRKTKLDYTETYSVDGYGVNMKIGGIYNVNKRMRVGLAVHTPSIISIDDKYNYSMEYTYKIGNDPSASNIVTPDQGALDYKIITPWRTMGSFAYLFGKKGFLTADLEYINYGNAKFEISENQFEGAKDFIRGLNSDIRSQFISSMNLKVGGEYAKGIWRIRGGLGFHSAPFDGDNSFSSTYSIGGGIRGRKAYLDVAYVNRFSKEGYAPYSTNSLDLRPDVDINTTNEDFILTLGMKF